RRPRGPVGADAAGGRCAADRALGRAALQRHGGGGGFAIAVIAACVLLCLTPARWLALPLRAVGAMPLTAYTAPLIAWAVLQPPAGPVGDELSAFRALEPFWPLTLATIAGCTLWTLLVGRGPLEAGIAWFIRTVTTSPGRPAHTP